MNYLGSKVRLSEFIFNVISNSVDQKLSDCSFFDLFAGTGAVGNFFHNKVKSIGYNDREYYSYTLNSAFYSEVLEGQYQSMLDELNQLEGLEGFIFHEYSESGTAGRLYFSANNGKKIDAMRLHIEQLFQCSEINEDFYILLIATLLVAADKIANIASVYCAYLKKLKKTATFTIELNPIKRAVRLIEYKVHKDDSNMLIKNIKGDILYLDPPYNAREYGSYYHLLNTISIYDTKFKPKGKTGIRSYETSRFCLKKEADKALLEILNIADFKHIFLSYNNEGFISSSRIKEMMTDLGYYKCSSIKYPRFKSDRNNLKSYTEESLHHLIKY
ncbi:DNA adenine methylase [Chryseobacterium sp. 5_R23647]|uniref:DNA adenine methylase n=1 Tax=Chryseobacterium sp. 5_R23647 TaxID=2258964 RepID=UPI000E2310E0|nr:DNA adenine methylase [Chryseobacterium sp. 5_R23647]REC42061.1 modification methylase [Chryseobacterium sp. 5_R23647]